ncbi:extracellular solute-binding protein [Clostridium sp. DL-VIII]|uniref:extracellular solute-binding protein n=1 Tax=Clostridium sp. DL-VIII TaxID=641107 RepID=UPI00031F14D2
MKKRLLSMILASMILLPMLTGCGNSTSVGTSTKENKVLKVAAFEGGYGKVYWEKLKENFEKEHEGVTVELTCASNLADILRPQIQAGNVPDFIYLATGAKEALTETFIKDQALSDLSGVLNKKVPGENVTVKEKILPGFLDTAATNPYGDGKTYLAPLFYSPTGLFYDKHLFEQKGYTLPKTWDENVCVRR